MILDSTAVRAHPCAAGVKKMGRLQGPARAGRRPQPGRVRHHSRKAMAEQLAGAFIVWGRFLIVVASLLLLLLLSIVSGIPSISATPAQICAFGFPELHADQLDPVLRAISAHASAGPRPQREDGLGSLTWVFRHASARPGRAATYSVVPAHEGSA